MSFFNDLVQKTSDASSKAVKKAQDMTEISKLNSQISAEEKKIKTTYTEIGEKYVELHKEDYEEAFTEMFATVEASLQKIKECNEQIEKIKGVRKCDKCGKEVPDEVAFCSACGNAMPKPEPKEEEEVVEEAKSEPKKCINCEAELPEGAMFCGACGTKQEE